MFRSFIACLLALVICCPTLAADDDSYVVLVSLDGFRWDYADAFDVPFFDRMAREGCAAVMEPSFPTKTFPNHYTLATGLVPDHHGIIGNQFLDQQTGKVFSIGDTTVSHNPRYFRGEPLWNTAMRQGLKAATIFWVGSDVPVQGMHPTYWHNYATEKIKFPDRVSEAIRLLQLPEQERPRLVMMYFEEPDASGHRYGAVNSHTRRATEYMDSLMAVLWQRLQTLPFADKINLIVTGDHGMTDVDPKRFININDVLPQRWVKRCCNDFPTLIYASAPQYVDSICDALQHVDHLRAWKRDAIPAYLRFGTDPNMGDVIALPDEGWVFAYAPKKELGSHGYDHLVADMQVAFRAIGPAFKSGYAKPDRFRNVCLYPLVCHLLGIAPAPNDGALSEVSDLLR